ncbi:MAG: hypothetical protein IJI44_01785 [Erysipelotrichaceae bacterium]|nr:hypothetical protein [Erysipelotrichaceae bacterium]
MEDEKIVLKPERKRRNGLKLNKISALFADKKKRYLNMMLFILPFLIAIGIFGFIAFKEAKSLLSLAKGNAETKAENIIESMNYVLRENATDYQKELFAELKEAVETNAVSDPETLAGMVCKNFIADFYTWTNKQGQYDIGGFYYIFDEKNETVNFKSNAYQKARDGFYKYLNEYINEYGSDQLLEVNSVEVTKAAKLNEKYTIYQWIETIQTGEETYDVIYDDKEYDAYYVSCRWTYKEETALNLKDFDTMMYFIVVDNNGRYEIVEASRNPIEIKKIDETQVETDETRIEEE